MMIKVSVLIVILVQGFTAANKELVKRPVCNGEIFSFFIKEQNT